MHIALIISSLQAGGAERALSQLANAWVLRGHHISLLTLSGPEEACAYPLDPRIQLFPLSQGTSKCLSLFVRFKNIVKRILAIRNKLKEIKPDLVISFVDVMNITTLLASRWLKIPIIVAERTHPYFHKLPRFYKFLRRLTYPWADKLITQTVSASDYFSTICEEKKVIIPNLIKKPRLTKNKTDIRKPVQQIISVGRLCPNKGFQILIKAFSEICAHYPDLKLTIYGEGIMRDKLEMLIQELHLTQRVFLPGTTDDIESVLHQSDLFVFSSFYEGFPNALCEAMAVGLPVIASNCSGNVDIIKEGDEGRLFPVGDVTQLTKLIQELIEDATQRLHLSQKALEIVDRYREPLILEKWDGVIADAVRDYVR